MAARIVIAIVVVAVVWTGLDMVLHGVLLQPIYEQTAELWRPMDEMNMPLMWAVTLVYTACFVGIYALMGPRSIAAGALYGALFGLAAGAAMGFGSYTYMPIPLSLALAWFFGTWVKSIIVGIIAGAIVRARRPAAPKA